MKHKDHYNIMGVSRDATQIVRSELNRARNALCGELVHHPPCSLKSSIDLAFTVGA